MPQAIHTDIEKIFTMRKSKPDFTFSVFCGIDDLREILLWEKSYHLFDDLKMDFDEKEQDILQMKFEEAKFARYRFGYGKNTVLILRGDLLHAGGACGSKASMGKRHVRARARTPPTPAHTQHTHTHTK